jgi:chromatin segregation and condensation protein Rec8/ScpA/Scc1 (kleisin family)
MPLAQRVEEIRRRLQAEGMLDLAALLGESTDIALLVVTFLAILELARMGALRVDQPRPFAAIRLRLAAA